MDVLEKLSRIFGGHDLRFCCESWSVHLDESHIENATRCERKLFLEGNFSNWPRWKGKATARLVSHRIEEFNHDDNGQPICGLVTWTKGYSISDGEIEGFDNGSIEVSAVVTPEIFDSVLTLLRGNGTNLRADFTLSSGRPEHWDGHDPLRVNAVGFFVTGY